MKKSDNLLAADLDHVLDHTRELWEEMRGQRIFITGGTGFFGCWLLESLVWANERLNIDCNAVVLTRSPQAFQEKAPHLANHPTVHLQQGDIRDFIFPPGTFPLMIHAATESNARLNREQPIVMLDTIIQGTHRALDFAAYCGTEKFLLTSSGAIYGKQPPEMTHIPEDYSGTPDPLNPGSAYGLGKRAAELLCTLYSREFGFQAKISRCFAFVGPYLPLDAHFAIGNFIRDALRGGPIIVKGDGSPYRSYLYAADLAIWLWTILLQGKSGNAYNVGSPRDHPIAEIADEVAHCLDDPATVKILLKAPADKLPERYVPAVTKAEQELHLAVYTSLEHSISRTMEWHREVGNYGT